MDLHKLASCLVRDLTISVKRHYELSRDYRAMADTWRQVLDGASPNMLQSNEGQDGKVGAPAVSGQDSFLFRDTSGRDVL